MPAPASVPPQLVFDRDVGKLNEWATRAGLPMISSAETLSQTYARAHRMLKEIRNELIASYGWKQGPHDDRLLFNLECDSPIRSASGAPRTPPMRLQIPTQPTSFFSEGRILQWQMVFHSVTFSTLRTPGSPISNLLNLLQCILPGMLVLVKEETIPGQGMFITHRALPRLDWMQANQAKLLDIFGPTHFRALTTAASRNESSFKVDHIPER